jgi:predicted RNA binding protein YcfA (HicA-like mRNA interferase family)
LPPLPVISGSACIAALAKLGYVATRQKGSHVRLSCPGRPAVTVPTHSTLDRGTLRSIIRTCELSVDDFLKLVG